MSIDHVLSVATTSTKSPPVIKSDIKRVLERMQVQYRETKGGYDCIHLPSIDLNSLTEAQAQRYHQHQRSHASEGTARRSLVHKASKLTFSGNKGKEKENDAPTAAEKDKEKEAPGRPSATASSGSSSFFNIPTATAGTVQPHVLEKPPSATGLDPLPPSAQAESSSPSLVLDDQRPRSPSKPKFLPPIPRDFAVPHTTTETSRPTLGEAEKDPFDVSNQSSLSVRFEINIVKVWILSLCQLTLLTLLRRSLGCHYMVYSFDEWAGMAGNTRCLHDVF